MAERIPVWSYQSRAVRRQREQQSLQQLGSQVRPLVGAGDPASLARARALTNIEARAERAAAFKASMQTRLRQSMGVASDRETMGVKPSKKKGRGLLDRVGDALGDTAGDVAGAAGGALGAVKDVAGDVADAAPGFAKRGVSAGLTALDAPRKYAGGPAWAIATGSLRADRKPLLDAQGNPTGRYYRDTPNFGDMAHSFADLLTNNPAETYQAALQANEERLADPNMGTFARVLTSGLQDPLTWVGPGAVKSALRFAPEAVRASKAAGLAAGILEQPKAVGLGGAVGAAAGADLSEKAGLGPTGQTIASLAGGALGGVAGAGAAATAKAGLQQPRRSFSVRELMTDEEGQAFLKGRKAGQDERPIIPSTRSTGEDFIKAAQEQAQHEGMVKVQLVESQNGVRRVRGLDADGNPMVREYRDEALDLKSHAPMANERMWFHSTKGMDYELPDPDMAVGGQTGITQGPGIYMAADPRRSSKAYGPRTFAVEFDGNTLDLTRGIGPNVPVFDGGPTWEGIRDALEQKVFEAGGDSPYAVGAAFVPENLTSARKRAHADLARDGKGRNGYVYKQALVDAVEQTMNDDVLNDLLGRFAGVRANGTRRQLAEAVVQNHLADMGVDGLFHHSPRADGDVLIVLNGEKARTVADIAHAQHAVQSDVASLGDIRGRIPSAEENAMFPHQLIDVGEDRLQLNSPDGGRVIGTAYRTLPGESWSAVGTAVGEVPKPELPWVAQINGKRREFPTKDQAAAWLQENGKEMQARARFFDEEGAASKAVAAQLGTSAAGAAAGYATGDDQQDRLQRAAVGAGVGFLGGRALTKGLGSVGLGIEDTHPHLEQYMDTLERNGLDATFDNEGRILIADPDEANRIADSLASEAHGERESYKGQWVGGGRSMATQFGSGEARGSGSFARKVGKTTATNNKLLDDAERIWEMLDDGAVDPAREELRRPWAADASMPKYAPLPDETYRLLESSWDDLAKGGAAGEAESKRLARRLGTERANRFLAERLSKEYAPAWTARDIDTELEAVRLFESKQRPVKGETAKRLGADQAREKYLPMVAQAYAAQLERIKADLEANGIHAGGKAPGAKPVTNSVTKPRAAELDAPAENMRPVTGPDGDVVAWEFKGGKIQRTEDGEWWLDYEGQRYVGESAADVVDQVTEGPSGEAFDALLEEDWPPADRAAFERPEPREIPSTDSMAKSSVMAGGDVAGEGYATLDSGNRTGGLLTAEAQALLRGPVPEKMTNALRRIGRENNVFVTGQTTPDELIAGLRAKTGAGSMGGAGAPPPREPSAPAGFPEDDGFDGGRVSFDATGVVNRPDLEEPDWLRNEYQAALDTEHERGLRATENIVALGGDPRDLPFALPDIQPGLTRMDKAGNALKRIIGIGVEEDPLATPAMRARKKLQPVINAQAARLGALSQRLVSSAFERDAKGRIQSLPGAPTIQDVAAALPRYEALLTADQLGVMRQLQRELEPYSRLIRDEAGIDIDSRADVAAGGGFYMPRGRAEMEGMDLPAKVPSGRYLGQGTRKGFEKEAVFATQAEGIDAGFEYPDIGETLQSYARDAGRRSVDKYTSDYFASLKAETGQNLGMTYADRIDEELRSKYQRSVEDLAKIRGRLATAERRAGLAAAQTDELDTALMAFTQAAGDAPDLRPVSRELAAQRRTARRLRRGQPGRRVTVDDAGNVVTHEEPFIEADTITRVTRAFEDLLPDSLDYADAVDRSIATTTRRLAELEKRGLRWKGEVEALRGQLQRAEGQLKHLTPEYRAAVNQARKQTRGTAQIGFVQLQGRAFPIELANVANKWLQAERPPMGKFAGTTVALDAFNNLMRGLRATGDASFLGIQGLLGATRDPKAYGTATRVAWKALADPNVLGAHIRDFDAGAVARDLPTSRDWARVGLHIGGADTEFAIQAKGLTSLGRKVQDLPVAKQSNRAFGYFGDVARMEIADSIAAAKKAAGVELTDDVLKEISTAANLMTGWSPNTFGGSVGQLAQFAPRFFQSQLELIGKMVSGGQIEKSEARKAMVRMLGAAVGITLLANELSPEGLSPDKVLSPWKKPGDPRSGWNSNFLRFRVGGTDATLLGPWDSLLRGVVETTGAATDALPLVESRGDSSYLLRSKASPALGAAWDLLSGKTALGEHASLADPEYLVRSLLPFSVADLGMGDVSGRGVAGLGIGLTGVKAAPLSPTEDLDRVALAQYGKDFYSLEPSQQKAVKDAHPDLWQRAVERGSAQRRRRETLRAELDAQQAASDAQLLSGKSTREDWIASMKARRDELAARSKEIYGEPGHVGKPKDALDRYFKAIEDATAADTGEVSWDAVDSWVSSQSEADQAYIERNTGLSGTPLVQLYRKLTREYYGLPKYRGYDADQARKIDELYTAVTNLARGDSRVAKSAALKNAAAMVGADEDTVRAVRRRIYGMLAETTDRAKWKKAHPEAAVFLGSGQLLPKDIEAVNAKVAA